MGSLTGHRPHGRRRGRWSGWRGALCGLLLCGYGALAARAQDAPPRPAPRLSAEVVQLQRALREMLPPAGAATPLRQPAPPTLHVVALRVEFQPDTSRYTTGDGTFDGALFDTLEPRIDPLPHDAAYFQAHLDFLEHYVATVSDGQTQLTTHLIPEVVRVSRPMGAYSPTGPEADSDAELARLAALVEEAWTLADRQSGFDPSGLDPERTVFLLFHAGVGRDIELTGTTFDRTPEDLPSLFFDEGALQRLLGGRLPGFKGRPVDHTMLIPRTETRRAYDFIQDQPFLAEISINGLLAASLFNALGVPDLFDTAGQQSAIGPFGLMDPYGFFAFNGLFPPEPSAWTRYYLGWADPVTLDFDAPGTHVLDAVAGPGGGIARAAISDAEYFLIENRYRDPTGEGLVMQVWQDGVVTEQRVTNGDETFNSLDVSGFIGGVVVGANTYDWALPGGLDEDGNELNGGILIWHVDERVLAAGLAANRVNADPARRGLDLEEADGAQDLGRPNLNPLGPEFDRGSPFDFWYEGNPVRVITAGGREIRLYQNRFGPDTYPSTSTNDGGPSFLVLEGFSAPGPTMTFAFRREEAAGIAVDAVLDGQDVGATATGGAVGWWPAADGPAVLVYRGATPPDTGAALIALRADGQRRLDAGEDVVFAVDADERLVWVERATGTHAVVRWAAAVGGPVSTVEVPLPEAVQDARLEPPLVAGGRRLYVVARTEQGGRLLALEVDAGGAATAEVLDAAPVEDVRTLAMTPGGPAVAGGRGARVGESAWTYDLPWTGDALPHDWNVGQLVVGEEDGRPLGVLPVVNEAVLVWLLPDETVRMVDVRTVLDAPGALTRYPLLADLDDDGRLDVLATYGAWLVAFTQGGAVVDGFPMALPAAAVTQPLVARFPGRARGSVLVGLLDGSVYAADIGGRERAVPGFPLAVGARLTATPLLVEDRLLAVAEGGMLRAWRFEDAPTAVWAQLYGSPRHDSYRSPDTAPPSAAEGGLLPEADVFNWPNPIRDGRTFIRLRPAARGRAEITIVDLAGSLVEAITIEDVPAGVPTEVLWQTDAASGIYVARVRFTADDGASVTRLITMAVIR